MGFHNLVVSLAALFSSPHKTTMFHQSEMFRSHITRDSTGLGQFANREGTVQEHLNNS